MVALFAVASFAASMGNSKVNSMIDMQIAQKIEALPAVELPSEWEDDFLKHSDEIVGILKKSKLNPRAAFQRVVAFNHRSAITNEGKYYTFVISLPRKMVLRFEGDDLWLIARGKKNMSEEQKKRLVELLK